MRQLIKNSDTIYEFIEPNSETWMDEKHFNKIFVNKLFESSIFLIIALHF